MKKYTVRIYYSTFVEKIVEEESEADAIIKAREFPIDEHQVLNNLENWNDADEIEKYENYES